MPSTKKSAREATSRTRRRAMARPRRSRSPERWRRRSRGWGLSNRDLGAEVEICNSGLYANFKSKGAIESATVESAAAIFNREVLEPPAGRAGQWR
jgi:hypothetical protein